MSQEPISWSHLLALASQWVERYRYRVESFPVLARVAPGWLQSQLPAAPPQHGEPPEAWFADLEQLILPAVTHWNHPGFLGYFGITGSAPGAAAELVSAALNVNGMLWKTCPALTELEQVVVSWYAQALGLPTSWFGMITDTASTSTLLALGAARERTLPGCRERGLQGGPRLRVYCSQEAHSSVDKAAMVLGIGRDNVVRLATDASFRLRVDALEEAIVEDRRRGFLPLAVVATVGTTSSTSVDPVPELADLCQAQGLWLHVDAAYAGSAAVAPEFRWALAGCERADSLVSNPHKWLLTPVDCSCLFTAHPEAFRAAYSLVPSYLTTDGGAAVDLMDYTFQLGRRFRALKLWFVFRAFGTSGLAQVIRRHVELARQFARWVEESEDFELLAPVPFSVVNFRWRHPRGGDEAARAEANRQLLQRVNAGGRVFLSHTTLAGRFALHLAVGNSETQGTHVRLAWEEVRAAAQALAVS
ncbi:MAG: pyridoxal-dependent decarboxylase [Thermoanaerobaculum sp.]|nr:pyridoxal-dependent decarboxylase [Thermoanaerobaculum sp.]MDW7967228.1 pyridoxal-dependent decarboxylase [Thermoanaerobaculum sp.]